MLVCNEHVAHLHSCLMISLYIFLHRCVHRFLDVSGNPLGCVQVPDSVTLSDSSSYWPGTGNDEMAKCGDNCTQLTVYVPSDGVCVQCPDGMRALGVGALTCSVLWPSRCFLCARAYLFFLVRTCLCVLSPAKCSFCGRAYVYTSYSHMHVYMLTCMHASIFLHAEGAAVVGLQCVAVCCSVV